MTDNQLTGKYQRLRAELEVAYAEPGWAMGRAGRIDRIANDLAVVERALAVQRIGARLINLDESAPAPSALSSRFAPA